MKQSTLLVIALVLLGGSALWITSLKLENYELKVEQANLRSQQASLSAKAAAPRPAAARAAAAPANASGRTVDETARQMMIDALAEATGDEKKAWIRVDPRDREASSFANQIAAVFRDQGWDTKVLDNEGLRFKPGLLFFVGDETEPPSYVTAAQKAIEAIGEEVTSGRGYRSYYENKKKESPDWQGSSFAPEQTFVLIVGRKPAPAAE
ncbi:MAG TPA: hypothetical protein VN634_04350 [Candidatus Limnocylindrales bacterium]|nr:hypothetical protein [Candidatus Limnocylindrales bacterium]